jgi:hypothetical protein
MLCIDIDRYGDTGVRSPLCGKQVKITNIANGLSVIVTIEDACPTCNDANSIDMSTGAFDKIANAATGLIKSKPHILVFISSPDLSLCFQSAGNSLTKVVLLDFPSISLCSSTFFVPH